MISGHKLFIKASKFTGGNWND